MDRDHEVLRRLRVAQRVLGEDLTISGLRLVSQANIEDGVVVMLDEAEAASVMARVAEIMQARLDDAKAQLGV